MWKIRRAKLVARVDKRGMPTGFRGIISFLFSGYRCSHRGRNTDQSGPSSAEVKNEWSFTTSPTICLCSGDKESFIFLLLGWQEGHGIWEFIILLHYHYHRHPEVDLPQVLTVSGLIPAVHLRTFHLCNLELFSSVARYSVLNVSFR